MESGTQKDGGYPDGEVAPVPVVDVPGAVVTESAVVTLVEVETADVVPGDPLVAVEESVEDEEAPTQLMSAVEEAPVRLRARTSDTGAYRQ